MTELPENVRSVQVAQREWNGVRVEVTEYHCQGRVSHLMPHAGETRLNAVLAEEGGTCEPRLRENRPCPIGPMPRHMFLAPAGLELWGYGDDLRYVKDVNLAFDLPVLGETMGFDARAFRIPRLRFADDRLWTLLRLLAEAVDDPDPSSQLFGDGLTAAIVARVLARPTEPPARAKGLAPWQLRRAQAYLEEHLPGRVDLPRLAALTGLSPSHFSRAFKASTGMAPYRWQLDARIRRAQALLVEERASLDRAAVATGFADAVHFGRTFRKITGTTPAAWRRDRIA